MVSRIQKFVLHQKSMKLLYIFRNVLRGPGNTKRFKTIWAACCSEISLRNAKLWFSITTKVQERISKTGHVITIKIWYNTNNYHRFPVYEFFETRLWSWCYLGIISKTCHSKQIAKETKYVHNPHYIFPIHFTRSKLWSIVELALLDFEIRSCTLVVIENLNSALRSEFRNGLPQKECVQKNFTGALSFSQDKKALS
jgi:hypothetical protein